MVKEIRKIGNSKGMIFDAAILDAMKVDVGDNVEVTLHASGSVTLTPITNVISEDQAVYNAEQIISNNDELFKRLS